ncbi:MAG: four helix bundle protein [Ferruginibacter sp.]|nr:four helix bundle protein [Ferruginibacter sp.]
MGMHNFRELKIWQRSINLAEMIYTITCDFPIEEKYGLVSQLRRCAVSVPSNISEGAGRGTNKQFRYFLEIAMGSCNELQTHLELSFRFNYISRDKLDKLNDEVLQIYKMILVFYNSLKSI